MPKLIWKVDIRWSDTEHLTDRVRTPDRATAEAAYRALLGRADLLGQHCAARLVTPWSRSAVYFSRFDREIGDGRIHPGAPLDLNRTDDGTAEATAWRPTNDSVKFIDWEEDTRPFAGVLRDWVIAANDGILYGARPNAALELRVSPKTLEGWLDGRPCGQEASMRRLMTMIIRYDHDDI